MSVLGRDRTFDDECWSKKMKKIDAGQTVSILANFGVIAGILLLAFELNQNRLMMRAQTRNAIAETLINLHVGQSSSSEFLQTEVKIANGEPLTALEEEKRRYLNMAFFRYWENVYYQYRNGLYDDAEYIAQREAWKGVLLGDETQLEQWCRSKDVRSTEFVAEIDRLLGESGCR